MPTYDANFSKTYEECCQLSARELILRQERLDWSAGIWIAFVGVFRAKRGFEKSN